MDLKSSSTTVENMLDKQYFIPRYQRPYSWQTSHIRVLYEDAKYASQPQYFIGSIVLVDREGNARTYDVVDGQQRITAIILAICAIRDMKICLLDETGARYLQSKLQRPAKTSLVSYALVPSNTETFMTENFLRFDSGKEAQQKALDLAKDKEEKLLLSSYNCFLRLIKEELRSADDPLKQLSSITDRILNLNLVNIEVQTVEEAYEIFETINTRGADLSFIDLIKTHLFSLRKPHDSTDSIKKVWEDLIETVGSDKFPEFVENSWVSRHGRATRAKIYRSIKSEINNENLNDFFEQLKRDAEIYKVINDPLLLQTENKLIELRKKSLRETVESHLKILSGFEVKQIRPWLLALFRQYNNLHGKKRVVNEALLKKSLSNIENFHFIFTALTHSRANLIQYTYKDPAHQLSNCKNQGEAKAIIQSLDQELFNIASEIKGKEEAFKKLEYRPNGSSWLLRYVLTNLMSSQGGTKEIDASSLTIEHLIPQSTKIRNVNSIGNLIMISESLNLELGTKPLEEKIKILKGKNIWLPPKISSNPNWGSAKDIEEMTSYWTDIAFNECWKIVP